jgi:hypothetical protein
MPEQGRDLERNSAFFLGAFGAVLGIFGAGLSTLGIIAWLLPGFARTAPDWFLVLAVVGLLGCSWAHGRRSIVARGLTTRQIAAETVITEGGRPTTSSTWGPGRGSDRARYLGHRARAGHPGPGLIRSHIGSPIADVGR